MNVEEGFVGELRLLGQAGGNVIGGNGVEDGFAGHDLDKFVEGVDVGIDGVAAEALGFQMQQVALEDAGQCQCICAHLMNPPVERLL